MAVVMQALGAAPKLSSVKLAQGLRWFWCAEAGAYLLAPSWYEARTHAQRICAVVFTLEKAEDPRQTPAYDGATVWVASGCDAGGRSMYLRFRADHGARLRSILSEAGSKRATAHHGMPQ